MTLKELIKGQWRWSPVERKLGARCIWKLSKPTDFGLC